MAFARLSELDDFQISDPNQDIRGREVVERSGSLIGRIADMIVDTDQELVDRVVLDNGRELPVSDLDIHGDRVVMEKGRTMTAGSGVNRARIGCSRIYPKR